MRRLLGSPVEMRSPSLSLLTRPAYRLLGVKLMALSAIDLNDLVVSAVASGDRIVVCSQNLHSAYVYRRDDALRRLQERSYIHIDGMPLVWLSRLAGMRVDSSHRVTWVDYLPQLLTLAAQHDYRVFHLGSKPDVVARALDRLRPRYPRLALTGHHGYFDTTPGAPDSAAVLRAVHQHRTQVLLVGMGMGRQERWVLSCLNQLDVNVIFTCGAIMEYVAGVTGTPPRWLGRSGLEWAYRLVGNPRRFWRRYLIEPWTLLPAAASDIWRHRRARRRPPSSGSE